MQCPNCGNLLAEGSRFCPYCGSAIEAPAPRPAPVLTNEGGSWGSDAGQQPNYGQQPYTSQQPDISWQQDPLQPLPSDSLNAPRGMKWFKFIIYFQLFANAAVNVYNAFTVFNGAHYDGQADAVYRVFPGMKTLDLVYGFLLLGLAVLAVFTRMRLAKFRRNGPALYYAVLIGNAAVNVMYVLLASGITEISVSDLGGSSIFTSVAVNVVMLIINLIYFGHRKDLFVN